MAISADQQATLQLLLERGQSYGDLAKLLGQDEAEVRARARAALTELGGADPDRHVGLTDYLLGQADPIGRADASRHLREDPADHQLAAELSEALRAMFPAAELPRLPGEPRTGGLLRRKPPGVAAAGEPKPERKTPFAGLSESQSRLIVVAAGAGVLLLVVVLAIAGVFGGGDEDPAVATDAPTSTTEQTDQEVQRVSLRAVGGGDASGEALFGLATGDQPFVDVSIDGLDPAPNDQTYVIWLMLTETQGYPLSPIAVSENGSFQDRFSIPSAVLSLVARVQFVDVSIAPVKTIRKLVNDAIENTALVLEEPGEVVLRGRIPKATGQQGGGEGSGG
jgi:anti-sigma factor RsiW